MEETSAGAEGSTDMPEADTVDEQAEATELVVQFEMPENPFVMQLEDNETAAAIAGYVEAPSGAFQSMRETMTRIMMCCSISDIPSR